MDYDPALRQTVLFGGFSSTGVPLNDTWTYDGRNWTPQEPSTSPQPRIWAVMAYDPAIAKMVLFGGTVWMNGHLVQLGDTWTYDGRNWAEQSPATRPSTSVGVSMAYDPAIGKLVLFGDGTWSYDGTTWAQQVPAGASPPTGGPMVYDPAMGKMVLFGAGTWTYDGTTWSQRSNGTIPPARQTASMTYDPRHKRIVLFGGTTSAGILNDTWIYDGTTWTQQSTAMSPPSGGPMAYDPDSRQIVLFSYWIGLAAPPPSLTWTYQEAPPGRCRQFSRCRSRA
jgi:hypothetical protein